MPRDGFDALTTNLWQEYIMCHELRDVMSESYFNSLKFIIDFRCITTNDEIKP